MTSFGDTSNSKISPDIRVDGISLEKLLTAAPEQVGSRNVTDKTHRFWASNQRYESSTHRDVWVVSFGSERLVNRLTFDVSHFPLNLVVQYRDHNGDWQALTHAKTLRVKRRHRKKLVTRYLKHSPVRLSIASSIPSKVRSGKFTKTRGHWHHSHWVHESWDLTPVRTSKIRFVFTRNHKGKPPRDFHKKKVPYSVALRNVQIGYKVISRDQIPPPEPEQPWWASSTDILGSQVVYSTYEQPASRAIDGSNETYWRSEPQPFPFAVVNMFLDLRDQNGVAPVIDRWWLDPVTIGPVCNVYYSNSVPVGDFDGLSDPIPQQWRTEVGVARKVIDGPTGRIREIALGPEVITGIEVSNFYQRMHYEQPWWLGIDANSLVDTTIDESHPLVSVGTTQIIQSGNTLQVIAQNGDAASIQLDPLVYQVNSPYRLVVAYYPYDPASQRDPYFRIVYQAEGYDPVVAEQATDPLEFVDLPVKIGLHPDPDSTSMSAVAIKGLTLKSESLEDDVEEWFLDEGADYVADPPSPYEDRGASQNARLRMHPMFVSSTNPFGVVGGAGNRFDEMEWTPINRDYTLKQGYMHIPPTRAKYWKFEMTNLAPEVYENFLTIDREVLVFPPDVVNQDQMLTAQSNNLMPSGVDAVSNLSDNVAYADVLNALEHQQSAPATATQVLVVSNPVQAQDVAKSGWVWTYQPWHMGVAAPQFVGTQQHYYEEISVRHQTKVAYFAGIKEIQPFRVDYTFDNDTDEYVDHLLDTQNIAVLDGMTPYSGGVFASGSSGSVTSKALISYQKVRGVQFAAQATDLVQVMEDPDFTIPNLDRWSEYGDAQIVRLDKNDILVSRGWFQIYYSMLEGSLYGELEGRLYGALEGNDNTSGFAEGGIISRTYSPLGAGKVLARVVLSTAEQLSLPVRVELIAERTGKVVALKTQMLNQDELVTVDVGFAPEALSQRFFYQDIEDYLNVRSQIAGGAEYTIAEATSDFDDDTYTAASGSVATSYGTLDPTLDENGPSTWSNFSGNFTLHVRYRSPVPIALTMWNTGVTTQYGTKSVGASTDEVTEVLIDCTAPSHVVLPSLKLGVTVATADRPDVQIMDWWIKTVDDVQVVGPTTYGSLEGFTYADLESVHVRSDIMIRVRQQGPSRDSFHVHRMALYDTPIAWYFSNDGGDHWWQAIDVVNDPYGVLLFPEKAPGYVASTAEGDALRSLRWKAEVYREGATINALHIRPWYGNRSRTAEPTHTLESLGPNKSIYDNFPATIKHPMWQPRSNPIEIPPPVETTLFWRNMVPDPSGEATDQSLGNWTATGGTIETGYERPGPDTIFLADSFIIGQEQLPLVLGDSLIIEDP